MKSVQMSTTRHLKSDVTMKLVTSASAYKVMMSTMRIKYKKTTDFKQKMKHAAEQQIA